MGPSTIPAASDIDLVTLMACADSGDLMIRNGRFNRDVVRE